MKYCPYCGADLPDGAVSFCVECGNALPSEKKKEEPITEKMKPVKKRAGTKKRSRNPTKPPRHMEKVTAKEEFAKEDDYDGYYDDILPVDEGRQREGIDRSMVKKIAILIGGLVVVIGICVAIMYLL